MSNGSVYTDEYILPIIDIDKEIEELIELEKYKKVIEDLWDD